MDREQIQQWDLRNACIHEAAHTVVARHLGYMAHFRVWETNAPDWRASNQWVGRTYLYQDIKTEHNVLICLAGSIAEVLDKDLDCTASEVYDYLTSGDIPLSDSDASGAGDYSEEDVEVVEAILREVWDEVTRDANFIISAMTDGS